MSGTRGTGWRFLPPEAGPRDDVPAALGEGPAALSRAIRALRRDVGAARTAVRLRGVADRPAAALRLLLVAPIQPRSLSDALEVGFAIAGFRVAVEALDGFSGLSRRLERGDEADMVLVVDPAPSAEPDPALVALCGEAVARLGAPAALARFGTTQVETPVAAGVDLLTVATSLDAALDRRFSDSFGTILRPAAADALADAAAAWTARRRGRAPKLVVTDLDGTLWDGVLGERSALEARTGAAPPLNAAYAGALKTLVGRGIVLAIASRNEPADVEAAFAVGAFHPLRREDIAAVAVGWEDKATLVAHALDALGLGSEHAVLVDDDPVNCAKVATAFAAMDVRLFAGGADAFARSLLADPLLLGGGAEAGLRAERYRAKAGVDRLREEAPDVGAFLAALGTRLTLQALDGPNAARAAELASRVNQFVLREHRPTVLDLSRRRSDFDTLVRLDDVFGAHGIVGLMLAEPEGEALVLDNLYLSCRALERGVEDAMLSALGARARAAGLSRITGRLEVLSRNGPARAFVERVARVAADGSFAYPLGDADAGPEGAPRVGWRDERDDAA